MGSGALAESGVPDEFDIVDRGNGHPRTGSGDTMNCGVSEPWKRPNRTYGPAVSTIRFYEAGFLNGNGIIQQIHTGVRNVVFPLSLIVFLAFWH